ncbi:MAG: hypothetical protein AAGD88_16240 [Bacteroidota bacterium]
MKITSNKSLSSKIHNRFFFRASVGILCFAIMAFGLKVLVHPVRQARYAIPSVVFHAVLMVLWLILFVVQTRLVIGKRIKLHRNLGLFSVLLVTFLIASGLYISFNLSREFHRPELLAINFYMLFSFVLLYMGGLYAAIKNRMDWHKRLLFIGGLNLLVPAYVRWCDILNLDKTNADMFHFGVVLIFPLIYDWTSNKLFHKATILGVATSYLVFGLGLFFLKEITSLINVFLK